jgi:hypothetical protein
VLPAYAWESVEVRVRRDHGATVLDRDSGVVSVGHQLAGRPCPTADILEDFKVERTGMDDPGIGSAHKLADKGEDLIVSW